MTGKSPDLAALLGSRICHDLISPIGAISNGVELMGLSDVAPGPEMTLISESVASANARLRFFRIAFGADIRGQTIGARELRGILADLAASSRATVDWRADGDLPRADVKLAFLLVQCLEYAMPFGGTITVAVDGTGWRVTATAEHFRADPGAWAMATDPESAHEVAPATVQFALAGQQLRGSGRALTVRIDEPRIDLSY